MLFFQAPRAANNGSGIGQLLRDPDHYEEINVIGNGESLKRTVMMMMMVMMVNCSNISWAKHYEYTAMTDTFVIFDLFILTFCPTV